MVNQSPKAQSRSNPISDSEILALYEAIIPMLSNNPEGLDITSEINKRLLAFVYYDFYHYGFDAPSHGRIEMMFEKWINLEPEAIATSVSMHPSSREDSDEEFEKSIERNYQSILDHHKAKHPEIREYDYHRIESHSPPRIVLGFFRPTSNPFTRKEKDIFDQLTPHIVALYRAVLNQVTFSQAFQYFAAFTQLGSKLASDYSLSDAEVRLIPDILFGHNNEAIAEKHFISVETVRSHIKHILKKTGTKSRLDFIGKFFTSPDHVQL
jgi:DNA-binding CsgD family transcriptional regulator